MRFGGGLVDGVFGEDLVVALLVEVGGLVVLDGDLVQPFYPPGSCYARYDDANGIAVFGG